MAVKNKEIKEAKAQMIDVEDLKAVTVKLDEFTMMAMPKEFSTGSKGWHANGKALIQGHPVQVNVLLTIVGSKPKAKEEKK